MAEMLLINPRRRRKSARRRNPESKATRRRAAKAGWRHRRRRRRNPESHSTRVRAARRGWSHRRRRRRNPIRSGGVMGQVQSAGVGALGALALDVALGYIPIPDTLKAGYVGYAFKGVAAIGLGMLAHSSKLVRAGTAAKLADGALTVVIHDLLKSTVQQHTPIQLGEYVELTAPAALSYAGSGLPAGDQSQASADNGMGMYDSSLTW